MSPITVFLILTSFITLTDANSRLLPRVKFTDKETAVKRLPLPTDHVPVKLVLDAVPGIVLSVGKYDMMPFNFQNRQKETSINRTLPWEKCGIGQKDYDYTITVVHKTVENHMFVCGTDGTETTCCNMGFSGQSFTYIPSKKMDNVTNNIKRFVTREGHLSALVESDISADLYITFSGSFGVVGVYKFGSDGLSPINRYKEHHYVGLVLSRPKDNHLQDKVYAFYNEQNKGTGAHSSTWLPYVTQVCMADKGGPKQMLQFTWTSQLYARLFCGDANSKQHFSELVDLATVHAEQWQDTRVYALFRNEWNMSAICVYSIKDIDDVFRNSPFKDSGSSRPRECVSDSKYIPLQDLKKIEQSAEMLSWVQPMIGSVPLVFKHHSYTNIIVDSAKTISRHPVLFLSLNSGCIHKVIQSERPFVIAEYHPFNYQTHILSITSHAFSRKLYMSSRSELVQLDVANCSPYGDTCEDCVLARDPYCGWNGTHCIPDGRVQDVAQGNYSICSTESKTDIQERAFVSDDNQAPEDANSIWLRPDSKYFLQCPVTSRHAQHTWHHPGGSTPCNSRVEQCPFLIDSMGPQQVGEYTCVSEEEGYRKVLAQYQLKLRNCAAGQLSNLLLWILLTAVLISTSV